MAAEAAAIKKLRAAAAAAGGGSSEDEELYGGNDGAWGRASRMDGEQSRPAAAGQEFGAGGFSGAGEGHEAVAAGTGRSKGHLTRKPSMPRKPSHAFPGSKSIGGGGRKLMRGRSKVVRGGQRRDVDEDDDGDDLDSNEGDGIGSEGHVMINVGKLSGATGHHRATHQMPTSSSRKSDTENQRRAHWQADLDDDESFEAATLANNRSELRAKFQLYRLANQSVKAGTDTRGRSDDDEDDIIFSSDHRGEPREREKRHVPAILKPLRSMRLRSRGQHGGQAADAEIEMEASGGSHIVAGERGWRSQRHEAAVDEEAAELGEVGNVSGRSTRWRHVHAGPSNADDSIWLPAEVDLYDQMPPQQPTLFAAQANLTSSSILSSSEGNSDKVGRNRLQPNTLGRLHGETIRNTYSPDVPPGLNVKEEAIGVEEQGAEKKTQSDSVLFWDSHGLEAGSVLLAGGGPRVVATRVQQNEAPMAGSNPTLSPDDAAGGSSREGRVESKGRVCFEVDSREEEEMASQGTGGQALGSASERAATWAGQLIWNREKTAGVSEGSKAPVGHRIVERGHPAGVSAPAAVFRDQFKDDGMGYQREGQVQPASPLPLQKRRNSLTKGLKEDPVARQQRELHERYELHNKGSIRQPRLTAAENVSAAAAAVAAAAFISTARPALSSESDSQPLFRGRAEGEEQLSRQTTDGVDYDPAAAGQEGVKLQRLLTVEDGRQGPNGRGMGGGVKYEGGDGKEKGSLAEEELAELDHEVIQEIYDRVEKAEKQVSNYLYLLCFLLFVCLYLTVLFLQVQSTRGFQITSAHQSLLPPGMTQSSSFQFNDQDELYQWLNQTVIQTLWKDPVCGDGICQRPLERRALDKSKGCALDCGYFPNVTQVQLFLSTNFKSEDARNSSSWNVCMTYPMSTCWYNTFQKFPKLVSEQEILLSLPDGDLVLILDAPMGGVRGSIEKTQGNIKSSLDVIFRSTLLSFGVCQDSNKSAKLPLCQQTCAMLVTCLPAVCLNTLKMKVLSGAYADCLAECQLRPDQFSAYVNATCNRDVIRVFSGVQCITTQEPSSPSRSSARLHPSPRELLAATNQSPPAGAAVGAIMAGNTTFSNASIPEYSVFSPLVGSVTLWKYLGPTDEERIARLQVAVNRLIFTMVKHECLAAVAQSVTSKMRQHLTAVLCTLMGGPASLQQCQVTDPRSKQQITAPSDLFRYAYHGHRGRSLPISREHMEHFKDLALMAVESVTMLDSAAAAALYRILSAFNSAISDPELKGCPKGLVLSLHGGTQYNSTVQVGGQITWTWNDDKPHSIQMSTLGLESPLFEGFGGGRLLLSKDEVCTPRNIGPGDPTDDPAPCVLRHPGEPTAPFSYTRAFPTAGTMYYTAQQFEGEVKGQVVVITAEKKSDTNSSLSFECQPGCQLALISNGRCDAACNTADCAFDGGDCSCSSESVDQDVCGCGEGQIMSDDGACCATDAVGSNLQFPFSLRTYGANASESALEFVEENRYAFNRYVAGKNRLLIGLLLKQSRRSDAACPKSRYLSLSGSCSGPNKITPFGRNPYFLPGSPLYNPLLASGQYSAALNINYSQINLTSTAPDGMPYGFYPVEFVNGYYPIVFGINVAKEVAMRRLQYLQSGFFLDNHTSELDVLFLTYNADERFFVLTIVDCHVDESGVMGVQSSIHPISFELYYPSSTNIFRMVLEILYVIGLTWNILEEFRQMFDEYQRFGAITAYFTSLWNWVDLSSIVIQIVCVGIWTQSAIIYASEFSTKPRYDIYLNLRENPFPWAIRWPPVGFKKAMSVFDEVSDLIELQSIYFCLQGINIFLYVMRILKLMDFQPHMGIFTRTLNAAANGLFHFFLLWVIVFVGFSTFGCIVFGRFMEPFSTLSSSMLTCFLIVLGDTTTAYYFQQLDGWEYAAAMIFWVSFVTIIVFILLNFLIAIIVDAFMDVKDVANEHDSLVADVSSILHKAILRLSSPYRRYTKMLRDLHALGGAHKFTAEELRFLKTYRKLRKSTFGKNPWTSVKQATRSDRRDKVFRIKDIAIDSDSLNIILDRALQREELDAEHSFPPEDLGRAVMAQFGDRAKQEDFEEHPLTLAKKRPKKDIQTLIASFEAFKEEMRSALQEIQDALYMDEQFGNTEDALDLDEAHGKREKS